MTGRAQADDPEIARLREAISADLIALRRVFSRRSPSPGPDADVGDQLGRILRGNPAWAAAAAAGALAGVALSVRNRLRGARPDSTVPPVVPSK